MAGQASLVSLDPAQIRLDPGSVRRDASDDLDGLVESIRQHGLLQPLGVAIVDASYQLVYGGRRREAAIRAGMTSVPCLIVGGSDEDRLVLQLVENLQRSDLGDMEKADGFARLRGNLAVSHPTTSDGDLDELVGKQLGLSERTIRRYLALRILPSAVQNLISEGSLTVTHAQHLGTISDPDVQVTFAELAVERALSAVALNRACRAAVNHPGLSPAEAIERGERELVVSSPIGSRAAAPPARLPRAPRVTDDDSDADVWAGSADSIPDDDFMPSGPATADGHRVFRIRTVSAFVDEIDRLARCLKDGDLARAADQAPDAPIQLRLAARQLDYVQRELAQLLRKRSWG